MNMKKKLVQTIRWGGGVFIVLLGLASLSLSVGTSLLWIATGLLVLPPITRRIPPFSGRKVIIPVGCVCLFFTGALLGPETEPELQRSGGEAAAQASAVGQTDQTADSKSTVPVSDAIQSSKIAEADAEKPDDARGQKAEADRGEEKTDFDREGLFQWISEKLSDSGGSETTEKEIRKWKDIDEKDFLAVWKRAVLEQIQEEQDDYNQVIRNMDRAERLYASVYGSGRLPGSISENIKTLSDKVQENEKLAKKYSFDLPSAYQNYGRDTFYITQRLEQSYSDNVAGKVQKELDSYQVEATADWLAYDVEYILDSPAPGENCRVLRVESDNPFPRADAYEVVYYDTGEIMELTNSRGFVNKVPVFRMIDNAAEFEEDAAAYAGNQEKCSAICWELMYELGADQPKEGTESVDAGTAGSEEPRGSVMASALEDSYSRTTGPACGLTIWTANSDGLMFAIGIGSGYTAYIEMRDCQAVWKDGKTAVYKDGDYQITITVDKDRTLTLEENNPNPYNGDFSLAGEYKPTDTLEDTCEFVFPESFDSLIKASDLEGKNAMECKIARNEIYARHGRMFSDEQLQGYFESCTWYEGDIAPEDFSDSVLEQVEKDNLRIIAEYEKKMGY